MWQHIKFKSSNGSASLAAAYLIFCVGLVGCTICTALLFHQTPNLSMAVLSVGGAFALLSVVLKLKPDLPSDCLWIFTRGRRSAEKEYTPRLIKSKSESYGTNRPPTAEEIRDLKDNPRNWVPSNTRRGRNSVHRP